MIEYAIPKYIQYLKKETPQDMKILKERFFEILSYFYNKN